MDELEYDEKARSATFAGSDGRPIKLSNITRERAEAFHKRYRAEAAEMVARGQRGDPLSFTGPSGHVTRGQ